MVVTWWIVAFLLSVKCYVIQFVPKFNPAVPLSMVGMAAKKFWLSHFTINCLTPAITLLVVRDR